MLGLCMQIFALAHAKIHVFSEKTKEIDSFMRKKHAPPPKMQPLARANLLSLIEFRRAKETQKK